MAKELLKLWLAAQILDRWNRTAEVKKPNPLANTPTPPMQNTPKRDKHWTMIFFGAQLLEVPPG